MRRSLSHCPAVMGHEEGEERSLCIESERAEVGVQQAWRKVDGKSAGKVAQARAGTRAGSVCQTAGELGEGGGVGGWEVGWGKGRGRTVGCLVCAESDRMWQCSLFSFCFDLPNPSIPAPCPARRLQNKNTSDGGQPLFT